MGRGNQEQFGFIDETAREPFNERLETQDIQCGESSGKAGKATAKDLKEKLERQQYCCAISGLPLTPDTASLDHKIPVSDGGDHSVGNLQWLHIDINRMKGALSQHRFEQLVLLMAENINPREAMQSS